MIRKTVPAAFLLLSLLAVPCFAQTRSVQWKKQGQAPALREGLQWINLNKPLTLEELKGRFVLLVFWTYTDVNSVPVWEDVRNLFESHEDLLTVIGVHSPAFSGQKDAQSVAAAVDRMDIRFPVVNDPALITWNDYGVAAWPTLVLIDPEGDVIFHLESSRAVDLLGQAIDLARDGYGSKLKMKRLDFSLLREEYKSALLFPRDVLADLNGERLFIADTGHRRVLVTDFSGKVLEQIGSGREGAADGPFETAGFKEPFGLALRDNILYIADRAGQKIRMADLEKREVLTLAGTGERGNSFSPSGQAQDAKLYFPEDVMISGRTLYIAMAGLHQIWAVDLESRDIFLFCGDGTEGLRDGQADFGSLAQPAALATDGNNVLITDSSSSALRRVNILPPRSLLTLLGKGMFSYGDADGPVRDALLQYPTGVAALGARAVIADTLNQKIKLYDDVDKTIVTLAGSGTRGMKDGSLRQAKFDEPSGIDFVEKKVFVADTNNQAIRVIDLENGTVSTLNLSF